MLSSWRTSATLMALIWAVVIAARSLLSKLANWVVVSAAIWAVPSDCICIALKVLRSVVLRAASCALVRPRSWSALKAISC